MNKWITLAFVLTLAVCASGCGESAQVEPDDNRPAAADAAAPARSATATATMAAVVKTPVPEDLIHRRFTLDSVDGREINMEDGAIRPEIEFNEGLQITGRVCNRYRGPAELIDGKLFAGNLATTQMLCVNSELDELEKLLYSMLREGAEISLTDDGMTLSQGGRVLSYATADWVR